MDIKEQKKLKEFKKNYLLCGLLLCFLGFILLLLNVISGWFAGIYFGSVAALLAIGFLLD